MNMLEYFMRILITRTDDKDDENALTMKESQIIE